jgi:hypothetical protein
MLPDADRMTRAERVASAVVLCSVWVFLGAVLLQNLQRPQAAPADATTPTATAGRTVSIYVTHDNQVYTEDSGVILSHVPLLECPHQVIAVEVSESGPFVTRVERPMPGVRAAYSVWIDRPYVVISSRMGIQLRLDDGEHMRLDALCNRANAAHMMGVFVRDDIVYLTDMSLGTSVPLFALEPHCRLLWQEGDQTTSAYPHEMSIPLTGVGNPFADRARLAFTFQTSGAPSLHAAAASTYHVVSPQGFVALSSDCGLLPASD